MNPWLEIKSKLSWSDEIEIAPVVEEKIIIFSITNSTNLGDDFYNQIITHPIRLKYVVCEMEELTKIDDVNLAEFKLSIEKLHQNGIEINLVGTNETILNSLKNKSIIPTLIREQNTFKQLSNCMLNISFK